MVVVASRFDFTCSHNPTPEYIGQVHTMVLSPLASIVFSCNLTYAYLARMSLLS